MEVDSRNTSRYYLLHLVIDPDPDKGVKEQVTLPLLMNSLGAKLEPVLGTVIPVRHE